MFFTYSHIPITSHTLLTHSLISPSPILNLSPHSDAAIRALASGCLHHAVVTDANGHAVTTGTAAMGAGINGGGINNGIGGFNGGSMIGGGMVNIGGDDDHRFGHMLGLGLGVGAGGR